MTPPVVLDLFSGDGGAGEGYRRAGFSVVGVDRGHRREADPAGAPLRPFAYPPGEFVQADALGFLAACQARGMRLPDGRPIAAVHTSPPCHFHTMLNNATGLRESYGTGGLLADTLAALAGIGVPYVVENVASASVRAAMTAAGHAPLLLCGSMFGLELDHHGLLLQLRRHRLFAVSFPVLAPVCSHRGEAFDVTGHTVQGRIYRRRREQGVPVERLAERRRVMGIEWMDREALAESIPPAFAEFLGGWLFDQLAAGDAA